MARVRPARDLVGLLWQGFLFRVVGALAPPLRLEDSVSLSWSASMHVYLGVRDRTVRAPKTTQAAWRTYGHMTQTCNTHTTHTNAYDTKKATRPALKKLSSEKEGLRHIAVGRSCWGRSVLLRTSLGCMFAGGSRGRGCAALGSTRDCAGRSGRRLRGAKLEKENSVGMRNRRIFVGVGYSTEKQNPKAESFSFYDTPKLLAP